MVDGANGWEQVDLLKHSAPTIQNQFCVDTVYAIVLKETNRRIVGETDTEGIGTNTESQNEVGNSAIDLSNAGKGGQVLHMGEWFWYAFRLIASNQRD